MQIHNNHPPSLFGAANRPEQAGQGHAKSGKFAEVATTPSDETTTDTAAPSAEVEEFHGPGKSVAHQARNLMATLSALQGGDFNFGWLVSQIARGQFDAAAYADVGTGDDAGPTPVDGSVDTSSVSDAAGDGTDGTDGVSAGDESPDSGVLPDGENPTEPLPDALADAASQPAEPTQSSTDEAVAALVDSLLEEGDGDPGVDAA